MALLVTALASLIVTLPAIATWGPVQAHLLQEVERSATPGRLLAERVEVGWFGPTRASGVRLLDARGTEVLSAERVVWDRTLVDWLLRHGPDRGRMTLQGAELTARRDATGRIDLVEALDPLSSDDSQTRFDMVLKDARIRVDDPTLAEPLDVPRAQIALAVRPSSVMLPDRRWDIHLGSPDGGDEEVGGQLAIGITLTGEDRLDLDVEARSWPLALNGPKIGELELSLDRLDVLLDATVRIRRRGSDWGLDGSLNLAECRAESFDPLIRDALLPARIEMDASLASGNGTDLPEIMSVSELALTTASGSATFRGKAEIAASLEERTSLTLAGEIYPNASVFQRTLDLFIEANQVSVTLDSMSYRLEGDFGRDGVDLARLEAGIALDGLCVEGFGLEVEPTSLSLAWTGDRIELKPVITKFNGGQLRVGGEAVPMPGGDWQIRIDRGSQLRDAEVNDDLSRNVLSYAAPVLSEATRVEGRVSATVDHADWILSAARRREREAEAPEAPRGIGDVRGTVVFDDVTFRTSPTVDLVLASIQSVAPDLPEPRLRIDDPVLIRVSEEGVEHSGLSLPIGDVNRIHFSGAVGFDGDLELDAAVPLVGRNLGRNPLLAAVAGGEAAIVPIRGRLREPRLDADLLARNLGRTGTRMLGRGAIFGAGKLIEALTRDPGERARRKAERAQKQRERQEERERRKAKKRD